MGRVVAVQVVELMLVDVVVFVVMGFAATKLGLMIEVMVVTVVVIALGMLETGVVVMVTEVVMVVKAVDEGDLVTMRVWTRRLFRSDNTSGR